MPVGKDGKMFEKNVNSFLFWSPSYVPSTVQFSNISFYLVSQQPNKEVLCNCPRIHSKRQKRLLNRACMCVCYGASMIILKTMQFLKQESEFDFPNRILNHLTFKTLHETS